MNNVFALRYNDIILQSHKFSIVDVHQRADNSVISIDQLGRKCLWKWVDDYVSEGYKK